MKNIPDASTVVSVLVVLMFGAVLTLLIARPMAMTPDQVTILNVLLGALATAFITIVNFWVGSSSGSKDKDTLIAHLSSNGSTSIDVNHSGGPN